MNPILSLDPVPLTIPSDGGEGYYPGDADEEVWNTEYATSFSVTDQGIMMLANGVNFPRRFDGMNTTLRRAGVPTPDVGALASGIGVGTLNGSYIAFVRYISDDNLAGDVTGTPEFQLVNAFGVEYTNLPVPSQEDIDSGRAVRRQILRNTDGQFYTWYVDIDTTDMVSTTLTSFRADADLILQDAVPLVVPIIGENRGSFAVNPDSGTSLNRNGPPPSSKTIFAAHIGRVFAAGESIYDRGHVFVTKNSKRVIGYGTSWTEQMAGRKIFVGGGNRPYEIESVSQNGFKVAGTQELMLTEPYGGETDRIAAYAITRPEGARSLPYSEAGYPEAWDPLEELLIQETNDRITCLISKGTFLYIVETKHVHQLSHQSRPSVDGLLALVFSGRGCVNNRCWITIEDAIWMLDYQGAYSFDGNRGTNPSGASIQDAFRFEAFNIRVNWKHADKFHVSHDRGTETIRWFICIGGEWIPRSALCFNYRLDRWWIERWPALTVGCSDTSLTINSYTFPRQLAGCGGRKFIAVDTGPLDDAVDAGKIRLEVVSADIVSVTVRSQQVSLDLSDSPIHVVSGRGKWQTRVISKLERVGQWTRIWITDAWKVVPDETSFVVIGGIRWKWRSGQFRWEDSEFEYPRDIVMMFSPSASTMNLRVIDNRSAIAKNMGYTGISGVGATSEAGSPDVLVDLSATKGWSRVPLPDSRDNAVREIRSFSVELEGVQMTDRVRIHELEIGGAYQ